MNKMAALFIMALIVAMFSLLTIGELWFLHWLGLDVIGHLKATYESGAGVKFFFEAFGAIAFVVGQPVILFWVLISAFQRIAPHIASSVSTAAASLFHL